ncbi:MAG: L,D-transpeptidase family protein [Aquirufa sp.]
MKYIIALVLLQFSLFGQTTSKFLWLNQTQSINDLDSLILSSKRFALHSSDYAKHFAQKSNHLKNQQDSIQLEAQIQKTAIQFFKHLAYGNQKPTIAFNGIPNRLYNYKIDSLVNFHCKNQSLGVLVTQFLNSSKEVRLLLNALDSLERSQPTQKIKIERLNKSINQYRWLAAFKKNYSQFILVNIPSTQLRSFKFGDEVLRMKVILGRPERPTRTLVSKIDQIIMNPYWYLPTKISVEEYLPKIKKDIGYLQKSHFQVFTLNYQPVNPFKINWHSLNANYFPYRLRENPNVNSTLGYLKFEFYSPFLIYLHDTAERHLFQSKRFFRSHGCVRLEKPFDLAKFILSDNPSIRKQLDPNQLSKNSKPKIVPLSTYTPLVIWYNLVDLDSTGKVSFYRDVYAKKNSKSLSLP